MLLPPTLRWMENQTGLKTQFLKLLRETTRLDVFMKEDIFFGKNVDEKFKEMLITYFMSLNFKNGTEDCY